MLAGDDVVYAGDGASADVLPGAQRLAALRQVAGEEGECIERVAASTDDNGKVLIVEAERTGPAFVVATGRGESAVDDACVRTFAYWNPRILEANRLLNPQTGEYLAVRVESMGRERLGVLEADRFRLVGTDTAAPALQIDLWYSPQRDWLALESRTPDGKTVEMTGKAVEVVCRQADGSWKFAVDDPFSRA